MSKKLKFLILGDVFGSLGRSAVAKELSSLKRKYKPDLIIANAENLTHGAGVSPKTIEELQKAGVQYFTGGNHMFDNQNGIEALKLIPTVVIRPANWHEEVAGVGFLEINVDDKKVLLINLIGQIFMKQPYHNPFEIVERILKQNEVSKYSSILIDMHAEASSEKIGMGYYLDGQASVVWGTHTHVPTADERILPQGTGFITDIGMTGPLDSVIGMNAEGVLKKFRFPNDKVKISIAEDGQYVLNAIYAEVNIKDRTCSHIERIQKIGTVDS